MMKPVDLIELQITLEYALDEKGFLVPFPGSSEQAVYIVYRYEDGYVPYYHYQLPVVIRSYLIAAGAQLAFSAPDQIEAILGEFIESRHVGKFISAYIPHRLAPETHPQVVHREGQWVILINGKPVCWAWSERSNDYCAEVAVETLPEYRHQGYARQVVAAWANEVIGSGRTALYSYEAENLPSQALARSLGAVWYADVIAFS